MKYKCINKKITQWEKIIISPTMTLKLKGEDYDESKTRYCYLFANRS